MGSSTRPVAAKLGSTRLGSTRPAGRTGRLMRAAAAVRVPRLRGLRRPDPSGRSILLCALALMLVVVLASPLQTYLNRRASVAASLAQQSRLHAEVARLQQQNALWRDPAYVERQARARLQYVRPGDTLYTVLGAQHAPAASAGQPQVATAARLPTWNAMLWSSVVGSDKAK